MSDRPICAHCKEPLSGRGRPSLNLGRQYHSTRRACRAAAQRDRRASYEASEPKPQMEKRPCSCCGDAMARRPRRPADLDAGRWCDKRRCQRHKSLTLATIERGAEANAAIKARNDAALLGQLDDPNDDSIKLVTCNCGRENAVTRFMHPDPSLQDCAQLGRFDPRGVGPLFLGRLLDLWGLR